MGQTGHSRERTRRAHAPVSPVDSAPVSVVGRRRRRV